MIGYYSKWFWFAYIIVLPIIYIGIVVLTQTKHSLRYNFPVLGKMTWATEWMQPKVYQYYEESDTNNVSYIGLSRNVIYQRSKNKTVTTPFETQLNVYETGHSLLEEPYFINWELDVIQSNEESFDTAIKYA